LALYIKKKEAFSKSPYFCFILHDICLSRLKLYQSSIGNRKTRKEYKKAVPDTSIFPGINNTVFRGLPVPIKVAKECNFFHDLNLSKLGNVLNAFSFPEEWILAYHNLEEINFLLLFPANKKDRVDNFVDDKDFNLNYSVDLSGDQIDFEADKIYIWPSLIKSKGENKGYFIHKDSELVDRFFLKVPNFFMSPKTADTIIWELANSLQCKPDLLPFSLLYDDLGHLLYIKHRYQPERLPFLPSFVELIRGCNWPRVNPSSFKDLSAISHLLDHKTWLSG